MKAGKGSPQLQEILVPGEDWQLVGEGYRFTEGPAANEKGEVYFNDIPNRKTHKVGLDGEVSVKPTQLGLDHDEAATLAHLVRIAEHAAEIGSYLWIDMEGSAYVEATIRLYEQLRAVQPRTGICLQAYLKRTAFDIERLLPLAPAIRLVKGAYDEPVSIAYRDRRKVDANYAALAVGFLLGGRDRPIRLGLGTHDVVWRADAGLRTGHLVTGRLTADGEADLPCDLLAVDEAYPAPVVDDAGRTRVHQAWRHGQVVVALLDERVVLAVPGTGFDTERALEALGRLARAVGARPERYAALLRLGT